MRTPAWWTWRAITSTSSLTNPAASAFRAARVCGRCWRFWTASPEAREGDIELLEELSEFMEMASLCALGKSAPNPVRSSIRYFRSEYEAHIREKRCPAGACAALIQYEIDQTKC